MAEQIPFGVAVSVINNLASFAFDEFGRIYGVKDELEKLKETLESIKVVISDAEQGRVQDPVNEHWTRRFRQVLLDADDLLDDLAIKDLRRKVDGGSKFASKVRAFFSSENQLVFRAKLARKIENIRKNCHGIADDKTILNLNPSMVVHRKDESDWLRNERETSSFVSQSDIIGREESKNDIVGLLVQTHASQNSSVVAIVGIGGLGKTALAQLVYNDVVVQNHFHKKMWVCVSENFEVKLLLKKMLKSLKDMEVGDLELDQLQKKLQDELNGQRYILVLDDVWNENQLKWNALRNYLMCGGQGSKILVTTRSVMVSETMGVRNPYALEGLTEEQSWALLKNLTFGEDTSRISMVFESIGKRIAKKCGGVPLAIKTMGSYLRNKGSDEWSSIVNADIWRLCEESESIMPVLKLSYQNLPLSLRQCFAYCSLYPKDWEISKDELIQLWMAQGYLASSFGMQSMEDMGNQYVKILLMRSFFQEESINEYDGITRFKMHDLMHDLATSVARNDCCFVAEGKGIIERAIHVAFESSNICSLDMLDASKVRTLICCRAAAELMTNPSCMKKLKYIRVLDLWSSSITQLPQSIDKIKHLRYLDLSYCDELVSLPKSIGNLVCLQTLKLQGCTRLVFPIGVVLKLINLRRLEIRQCKAFQRMMPTGLGKLTSLQCLSSFVVGENVKRKCGKLNELKELNDIRGKLRISELGLVEDVASEAQEANLVAKKHIRRLWLSWGPKGNKNSDSLQLLDNLCPHQNLRKLVVEHYPGERFSSWLSTLNNIVKIKLSCLSNCQHLPPLERLPFLKKLDIGFMGELQCIHYEEISDTFFPSLETLSLFQCNNLRGWQKLEDDNQPNDIGNHLSLPPFPRLSSLNIYQCPNLNCMPTFPHLVEDLELCYCSMSPLIETCLVQLEPSSFIPLHRLRRLKIDEVTEAEALAENWMRNLKYLESLTLGGSNITQHISRHLQHLPSQIQELEIINMPENDTLSLWEYGENNGAQFQAPFHCLLSLQQIIFTFCFKLRALPEQIGELQSLRYIGFRWCPELESLPEAMCRLTNLQSLRIRYCPLLLDRCGDESGQDWPKIAHIPNRDIH